MANVDKDEHSNLLDDEKQEEVGEEREIERAHNGAHEEQKNTEEHKNGELKKDADSEKGEGKPEESGYSDDDEEEDESADQVFSPLSGLLHVGFSKLTQSADIIHEESGDYDKIPRANFETAIHSAGYGKFQGILLVMCGIIYATCAMSTITLSFVLPAAACEFQLSSSDKGKLNATPLIGMCVGSYIWGNLADARGRKWMIILSLLIDAFAAFASSLVMTFPVFLICRFFCGFGIIGATSLVFPYFGDFLSLKHRDKMLVRLEVFWTLGTIILPAIAWAVIPEPWTEVSIAAPFNYTSWRVFVAICGAPSLIVAAILSFFPESPRYLLASGQPKCSIEVMKTIFTLNKSQPKDNFPVQSLSLGHVSDDGSLDRSKMKLSLKESVRIKWDKFWERKKTLTNRPYIGYLILCCFIDFCLMFSYYTLMMWFPDLFERFGQFAALHPDQSAGVCDVTSIVVEEAGVNLSENCDKPIDSRVFLYTLLVGLSCLPTSVSVGLLIDKLGKKVLLAFMLISSGLAAVGLNFVVSSTQNLVLSCIFEAIISCTEAVLFCVICEIFPTSVAGTAMSVTVLLGRVGAIVGNVIFGALVDFNCYIPIYMFGGLLITSGFLVSAIPKSDKTSRRASIVS